MKDIADFAVLGEMVDKVVQFSTQLQEISDSLNRDMAAQVWCRFLRLFLLTASWWVVASAARWHAGGGLGRGEDRSPTAPCLPPFRVVLTSRIATGGVLEEAFQQSVVGLRCQCQGWWGRSLSHCCWWGRSLSRCCADVPHCSAFSRWLPKEFPIHRNCKRRRRSRSSCNKR